MDLGTYVSNIRQELALAAEAGGDDARALAERLAAPLAVVIEGADHFFEGRLRELREATEAWVREEVE